MECVTLLKLQRWQQIVDLLEPGDWSQSSSSLRRNRGLALSQAYEELGRGGPRLGGLCVARMSLLNGRFWGQAQVLGGPGSLSQRGIVLAGSKSQASKAAENFESKGVLVHFQETASQAMAFCLGDSRVD